MPHAIIESLFSICSGIYAEQTRRVFFEQILNLPDNLPAVQMVCVFSYFPPVIYPLISF
jgi:hypothetical protein